MIFLDRVNDTNKCDNEERRGVSAVLLSFSHVFFKADYFYESGHFTEYLSDDLFVKIKPVCSSLR